MLSQDIQPFSSRVFFNTKVHLRSVPSSTDADKCPVVNCFSSTDNEHHVFCDVYYNSVRCRIDTQEVSDYVYLITPYRDGTDTKKSLSVSANFPFLFPSDIYCHTARVTSVNDNITLPCVIGVNRADTSELIEALTQLSLRPQTRIVREAEFHLESELNARRARA